MLYFLDTDGCFQFVNAEFCNMLGYAREELIGMSILDTYPLDIREDGGQRLARIQTGHAMQFERTMIRKDGSVITIEASAWKTEAGNAQAIVRNITERKRAEEALRRSEEEFRLLAEAMPQIVWTTRADGWTTYFNHQWIDYTGLTLEESYGPGWNKPFHPEDQQRAWNAWQNATSTGGSYSLECRLRRADGVYRWWLIRGVPVLDKNGEILKWFGTCTDIEDMRRAEEEKDKLEAQLYQAQKMESVGRLAGGVAHDFNNMLGVILGHSEIALDQIGPTHPVYSNLTNILEATKRSADLTRQLLAFARKQPVIPQVLNLNETISGMLKMLERLIGENIRLDWRPGANTWLVKIDPSQIDQILANLCVNSLDSITDVGRIVITTENCTIDKEYCSFREGCKPGEYVRLTVTDDGCGMDKDILGHIFEPFFTTKGVGKGTGLGLATVYGAVRQNNGFIDVESKPGSGTTITIYLPRHEGEAKLSPPEETTPGIEFKETVLLVEDEPAILTLATRMMQIMGHTVLAVSTPLEAVRLAQEYAGKITLLMTDVIMPEMNGRSLAEKLKAMYSDIECLFMSGYTADVISQQGVLDSGTHFLKKPFSKDDLAAALKTIRN